MLFCPNTSGLDIVWKDDGFDRCLYDTVTSVFTFLAIVAWTVAQCVRCRRHGEEGDCQAGCDAAWLRNLRCVVTLLLALEALVHMIVQDLFIQQGLYGYNVLTMLLLAATYLHSLLLSRHHGHALTSRACCGGRGVGAVVFWTWAVGRELGCAVSCYSPLWWWRLTSAPDQVEFALWVTRLTFCLCLLLLSIWVKVKVKVKSSHASLCDVTDLHDINAANGAAIVNQPKKTKKEREREVSAWRDVGRKVRLMAPLVWPRGSRLRQAAVVTCVLLLAAERVVNVFVPLYSKQIVNVLSEGGPLQVPWGVIVVYCALLYLKGSGSGGGVLQQLRQQLWIKVQQFTSLKMNVRVFKHIHSLSMSWHLQRKTGEVIRVVDQGTASLNTVLNQALFQIFPTMVDCVIAVIYFVTAFNYLFGLIIFACVVMYIVLTYLMMEWRTKFKREMKRKDKEVKAKAVDSLLNFETVKYYGATEFEVNNYRESILGFQQAEWKSQTFLTAWQATQNTVTMAGQLGGTMLCVWAVVHSVGDVKLTVGDYVLFASYLGQLFGPLNSLGEYYRTLQKSFIDMENMFELLDIEPEVKDAPDARDLAVTEGRIEFRNVCFHYDPSRPILRDVSFTVAPGQTVALVGHTGSGKSTIIRLLFRLYDVTQGSIVIDGQDIAMVTQASLRDNVGVVPQDTVLFNRDILYNILYGRCTASRQEVEQAATAAQIHDRILKFPSEYHTVVGERGLKLSGGEKQRVAIARTLLKAPTIVLLDEATSALDTKTEGHIQTALASVCRNRTTIVIAHRLSTIVNAHHILVLHEGQIVERGTHTALLDIGGHYAELWQQQQKQQQQQQQQQHNLGQEQDLASVPQTSEAEE